MGGHSMLARTRTTRLSYRLGKEIECFVERLEEQMRLFNIPFAAKFGGAGLHTSCGLSTNRLEKIWRNLC
jgi:hypothetical protein